MPDWDPDFMPDVHEGSLDADGVRRLLSDVDACATLESVTVKRATLEHADKKPQSLHEAANELFSGGARAIQLRYLHRGQGWTDTILRVHTGYRLIRIATPMNLGAT